MGTSRGTTGHGEATNEGQPAGLICPVGQEPPEAAPQLSGSPLFVMQHAGQKTQAARRKDASKQQGGGQAPGPAPGKQGRVTVRTEGSLWKNGVRCSIPWESVAYRPENLMPSVQFELSVR